jgi:hopanoid biosynthesis associated radical SAM protein HpnH
MAIPLLQVYKVARYIAGRKLRRDKRYPLVLMLEPLFQCNLACSGCGKIDYPKEILQKRVSVEDAMRAVDECGAPIVSIPGGEPLIHKEMPQIVAGIVAREKFVYLCTNAILLSRHIDEYKPSPYLTFSIHLDGNRQRHDESVCQEGVFDKAVAAIELAKSKGFRVTVNCTLFQARSRRHHGIAGVQLSPCAETGCIPGAQCQQTAVSQHIQPQPPAFGHFLVIQSFGAVPRFSRRQSDLPVHPLEQSHL